MSSVYVIFLLKSHMSGFSKYPSRVWLDWAPASDYSLYNGYAIDILLLLMLIPCHTLFL